MKQAILLLSNRTDYAVRERYDKLVKDYGHKADVYLLFDATKGNDKQKLEDFEHVYLFDVTQQDVVHNTDNLVRLLAKNNKQLNKQSYIVQTRFL